MGCAIGCNLECLFILASVSLFPAVSHHFAAHEGEVNAIRFSTQGKFLATGGADRKVKLWKEEGGKADLVGTLTGEKRF